MIFEHDDLVFSVQSIVLLDQKTYVASTQSRGVDSISFRFTADSVLESNGKVFKLSDNSICFVPADTSFSGNLKNDKRIVIHFNLLNYKFDLVEVFNPSNPEKLAVLFAQAYECWTRADASCKYRISGILNLIFAELYEDNCPTKKSNTKIADSVKYINQNLYSSNLSLSDAAKKSFVSYTYFGKLFRKEFGISPKEYVIRKRIEYATSLILAGDCSLKEVAIYSGYNDYKLFFMEFKRLTGQIPSEYSGSFNK